MSTTLQTLEEMYLNLFTATKSDIRLIHDYTHVLPWTAVAIYVFIVFVMPKILLPYSKSKGYASFVKSVVSPLMFLWNMFLSVGSLAMFLGTLVPYITTHLTHYEYDIVALLCDSERRVITGVPSTMVTFAWWFTLSKYFELIDTVFLVVKKPERPVPFLHWYHHLTVLLFTWYAAFYNYTAAPPFIIMNAFIHTIMYYYYAMTEIGRKPTWDIILTVGQILQMVFGIVFNVLFAVRHMNTPGGCGCDNPRIIFTASVIMYGSYLFLFCRFFVRRYLGSGGKKPENKKKTN